MENKKIEDVVKVLFDTFINKKENDVNSSKFRINNFNPNTRIQALKEKEIKTLINLENLNSNVVKCQRLLEVYTGVINNTNHRNYFSNLQWYKHFNTFRQDYLYEFSNTDKLRNEYILRELVTNPTYLEKYNLMLEDKGLRVILANPKRLKEDTKYSKYINILMPFITTLKDESYKKDTVEIKVDMNSKFIELNQDMLEDLLNEKSIDDENRNQKRLIEIREQIKKELEKQTEEIEKVSTFNKYNFLINMYDIKDFILFGVFFGNSIDNPSRRELDKRNKILNRKNLMYLIDNSIVINFNKINKILRAENKDKECLELEIDENILKLSEKSKKNFRKFILEVHKDDEFYYKDLLKEMATKDNKSISEEMYNFFEEQLNINFTNKIYNLDLSENIIVVNDDEEERITKYYIHLSLNEQLKTKYIFKSNVSLNFITDYFYNRIKVDRGLNDTLYKNTILYRKIQDFFYKNNAVFSLNAIDFIVAFFHYSFISINTVRLKNNNIISDNEILNELSKVNEIANILKPKEFKMFNYLMEILTDLFEKIEDFEIKKRELPNDFYKIRATLYKNKKKKNSFNKSKIIDFENFTNIVLELQETFYSLLDDNFYNSKKQYRLETYCNENTILSNYINDFFLIFIVENYIVFHNDDRVVKEIDNNLKKIEIDLEKEEMFSKQYFKYLKFKVDKFREYHKTLSLIKEDINLKIRNEEEIRRIMYSTKEENADEKERKLIYVPKNFIDIEYSIFQKSSFTNTNITKEINAILKLLPNMSKTEFITGLNKYYKDILKRVPNEDEINSAVEYLEKHSLFSLEILVPKVENYVLVDTLKESFYFKNVYDIFYFVYLYTLILFNELRNLKYHENVIITFTNPHNLKYNIKFSDEQKLKQVLNLLEIIKSILSLLGVYDYNENPYDELIENILNKNLGDNYNNDTDTQKNLVEWFKKITSNYDENKKIDKAKCNLFHYYISMDKKNNINIFNVKNLFLLSTKNIEYFRYLIYMLKLNFNNTMKKNITEVNIITRPEKNSLVSFEIDNSYNFYLYPNENTNYYHKLKEDIKQNTSKDYYKKLEEYINANKTIYLIKNFIRLSKKDLGLDDERAMF